MLEREERVSDAGAFRRKLWWLARDSVYLYKPVVLLRKTKTFQGSGVTLSGKKQEMPVLVPVYICLSSALLGETEVVYWVDS